MSWGHEEDTLVRRDPVLLFGVRSPVGVEIEETLLRCGVPIAGGVNVGGPPRLLQTERLLEVNTIRSEGLRHPFYACAFEPIRRAELTSQAISLGLSLADAIVDPHAVVARSVRLGAGTWINVGAIVGAASVLGEGVLVNRGTTIGHHALVGDGVSFGPGVTVAGNVRVGAGAMIGIGSVVLPDVRIGEGAVVAGGSLVREDVAPGAFVAGSPATERPWRRERSTLHIQDGE